MPEDLPQAVAARLAHALDALETQRRRAAGATVVLCGQIVVLAVLRAVAPLLRGEWVPDRLFAAMATALFAGLLLGLSKSLWRRTANRTATPILAETLGMTAETRSGGLESLPVIGVLLGSRDLFDLDPAFELGLLPRREWTWTEWTLAGEHRSLTFTMASVVQQWRRAGQTGQTRRSDHAMISIAVPVPFRGRVLIGRDGGLMEPVMDHLAPLLDSVVSRPDTPQRLRAPDEAFERRFTVRADDPAEAQRLVTPAVAEGLLAIDDAASGRSVRAAFDRGRLWLALDLPGPMLQQADLFRPASAMLTQVREVVDELSLPHRLIDYLHGGPPP